MEFLFAPACNWQRKRLLLSIFVLLLVLSTVVSCGGGGGGDSSPAMPPAPTGVTATAGDNSASIAWSSVAGATSYNLYYSTTTGVPKATASKITGVTSPRVVTGLANGTTYFFVVTAVNAVGESADSSQVSAKPILAPPPPPMNISATAGHGEATIGWDNVAGATSYNLYYSTTAGVNKVTGSRFTKVTSPNIVTGLTNGTTYYFVVTAVNTAGEGVESSQVSAMPTPPPPPAPTGVVATAGHGEVTISWSAVAGATSYNIYFDYTTGVTKTKNIDKVTGVTASPKVVTGLANGTMFYFVVTALNANGESVESSQVSATPTPAPPPPPSAPTGVTATADFGEATISWSGVTGATSYNIYYSTTTGVTKTTGTKVAGAISPKVFTGLIQGTQYYFVVTAVNANGESVESSQVSATPFVMYVAIGDSITMGDSDDYTPDDTSLDGRNTGGGYEPILNNLLTSATGIQHSIINEGVGGNNSSDGLVLLPAVLATHPKATYYLIEFGTVDAHPSGTTPSGLGLSPGNPGYNGSYKDNMQRMISAVKAAGKIPFLAKVPYSLDSARIPAILEYNQVIDELVAANGITVTPPDFYSWFQARPEQLADLLHPNGIGYQSMANLWRNALRNASVP